MPPALALALTLVGTADAHPPYLTTLTSVYPAPGVAARACANCHASLSDFSRNAYGRAAEAELKASRPPSMTVDLLRRIEGGDADADGVSNGDELRAGTPPGTGNAGATAAVAAPDPAPVLAPPYPRNGFHPAVVHFPIALFIAGVLLDFVGMIRRDRTLLHAGWYNLVLAAISAVGAMLTGLLALRTQSLVFEGTIRLHITLAVVGAAVLWALVGLRIHRHEAMSHRHRWFYYLLAAVGLVLIGAAGHVGGTYVYGE